MYLKFGLILTGLGMVMSFFLPLVTSVTYPEGSRPRYVPVVIFLGILAILGGWVISVLSMGTLA